MWKKLLEIIIFNDVGHSAPEFALYLLNTRTCQGLWAFVPRSSNRKKILVKAYICSQV